MRIVAGDIELTAGEGQRLAAYVEGGGTLLCADGQLKGPGAAILNLPELGPQQECDGYRWSGAADVSASQRYRCKPITGGQVLTQTPQGVPLCASFDRGKGRLVFLSVPYALGIDRQVVPIAADLFARLTRGLMPIEVEGDVEWQVNRSSTGWLVTLINPAGVNKTQQGMAPTDFRENRQVIIRSHVPINSARDRLLDTDQFTVTANAVPVLVGAGNLRIIELR